MFLSKLSKNPKIPKNAKNANVPNWRNGAQTCQIGAMTILRILAIPFHGLCAPEGGWGALAFTGIVSNEITVFAVLSAFKMVHRDYFVLQENKCFIDIPSTI